MRCFTKIKHLIIMQRFLYNHLDLHYKKLKQEFNQYLEGCYMGYKGSSQKFLELSGISIGDIIKITKNGCFLPGNST